MIHVHRRPAAARRGMLLLVVLGMLAMFSLIAITFVVIASHNMRSARVLKSLEEQADPPDRVADRALRQLLRDTPNNRSAAKDHSLLRDMYGSDWLRGTLTGIASPEAGGQLIKLQIARSSLRWPTMAPLDPPMTAEDMAKRVGCVLTMFDGPASGCSTRIVGLTGMTPAYFELRIVAFEGINFLPALGDRFLINAPAFNGTGFGFNASATAPNPLLTQTVPVMEEDTDGSGAIEAYEDLNNNLLLDPFGVITLPIALLPNHSALDIHPALDIGGVTLDLDPDRGGANEEYDAVDYQNMAMAMMLPNGRVPSPSFHRPALINYWANRYAATGIPTSLLRRIVLRPLVEDHPDFNGSNSDFTLDSTAIWDVDCDGDGNRDSIWVDMGMPVRQTADGRKYKPLVAVLCVDMDGRLNLNAQGCTAQLFNDYYDFGPGPDGQPGVAGVDDNGNTVIDDLAELGSGDDVLIAVQSGAGTFAGGAPAASLHRGQGYGPPEVNLQAILPNQQQYRQLLLGREIASGVWVDGRYGETLGAVDANGDDLPDDIRLVGPGQAVSGGPFDDLLGRNKHFEFASLSNYRDFDVPTAFGTVPDFKGTMAIGLDVRGTPLYLMNPDLVNGSLNPFFLPSVNDPYEKNLRRDTRQGLDVSPNMDNLFTVAELERVLRQFDRDQGNLPKRLELLAASLLNRRHEITTESWDVPAPRAFLPTASDAHHFADLLPSTVAVADRTKLVPRELLAGLPMDLNWPFGNGIDEQGNGVVDEPGEAWLNERYYYLDAQGNQRDVYFDHCRGVDVNGSINNEDRVLARQLYARYLYVLACLVTNPDPTVPAQFESLAQWAVNVVDFRDRDSIMTPFEYDLRPFDEENPALASTWDVDGVVGLGSPDDNFPYRGLVWGCEQSPLLISETTAFHDRRSQDLSDDGGTINGTPPDNGAGPGGPQDHDQRIYPEASLFIELYNPASPQEHLPGEFCYGVDPDSGGTGHTGGVLLQQTAPPTGDPVFRLIIARPFGDPADANFQDDRRDPDYNSPPGGDRRLLATEVERSVYFVDIPAAAQATYYGDNAEVRYYPSNSNFAKIMPGRYAVIGPADSDVNNPDRFITNLGFQTSDGSLTGTPAPRRIVLAPNPAPDPTPDANQVEVYTDSTNYSRNVLDDALCQNAVAIPIDQAYDITTNQNKIPRLSVSEPTDGYPLYNPADLNATEYPVTSPNRLRPVDLTSDATLWGEGVGFDGTTPRFRVVYLQRLANPLLGHDAEANPYLTLDSMQVDLTAFNGVDSRNDPAVTGGAPADYVFNTRQRGTANTATTPFNIWAEEPETDVAPADPVRPGPGSVSGAPSHVFAIEFSHSLGWLNAPFGVPRSVGAKGDMYWGDPQQPFPWLSWINRPFVNRMELMMVPSKRSSQLFRGFTIGQESNDPYGLAADAEADLSFQHLAPLFSPNVSSVSLPNLPEQLQRILEFVHVPSRFVDTEIQGNPAAFDFAGLPFRAPFNRISRYREPGKININTVFSPDVWNGLMNNVPGLNDQDKMPEVTYPPQGDPSLGGDPAYWQKVVDSRRGDGALNQGLVPATLNPALPTRFANPFRSFAGSHLVPLPSLKSRIEGGVAEAEVNATLLRKDPAADLPLFRSGSSNWFEDTGRNPYFRYRTLQQLGAVTTTRSNVYAIWITVGNFEVEKAPMPNNWTSAQYAAVYPDGYTLKGELGVESGEITRHRAFYMIDRSIPVAFEPGKDHNVEDAVLLRRYIE